MMAEPSFHFGERGGRCRVSVSAALARGADG